MFVLRSRVLRGHRYSRSNATRKRQRRHETSSPSRVPDLPAQRQETSPAAEEEGKVRIYIVSVYIRM